MQLSRLDFAAFLSYTPRPKSPDTMRSRDVMFALKKDGYVGDPPILMSELVAQAIHQNMATLPFASFFQADTVLVPTPKSSLMKPDTLWVPERIATALVKVGLGREVVTCLVRANPVAKAAICMPSQRPTVGQHYESLAVQGRLSAPDEIVLVDDIITRGATLLGCANRLADSFPQARIRAFAAMRTVSNPFEFVKVRDPVVGFIELRESGDTLRRP